MLDVDIPDVESCDVLLKGCTQYIVKVRMFQSIELNNGHMLLEKIKSQCYGGFLNLVFFRGL